MPSYAELAQEVWWRNEYTPSSLQRLIVQLRAFYGVPAVNIGARGDNNHLRGYHRSSNWIRFSRWCVNTSYSITETPGNRNPGDGDWLSAVDITVPLFQLIPMCQRLDQAVRAGLLEKVTEWYGNDDGDNQVDGYDNIRNRVTSSDMSHLWHLHLSFDRRRVGENHDDLFRILTGVDDVTPQEWVGLVGTDGAVPAPPNWGNPNNPSLALSTSVSHLLYEANRTAVWRGEVTTKLVMLTEALRAILDAGGSPEAAPILARIDEVSVQIGALQAENDELRQRLAAALAG